MMNGSRPYGSSDGLRAPSPKRKRPRLRVSCSPSPQPSPEGEGETFARALVIRSGLVVVRLRNERQRSGDCSRNVRIFQHRASALPLLGERVGVRGNEANSNPGRTTTPELSNFASLRQNRSLIMIVSIALPLHTGKIVTELISRRKRFNHARSSPETR